MEYKIKSLDEISNIMKRYNNVLHLIDFFQIRYIADKKKRFKHWFLKFSIKDPNEDTEKIKSFGL